MFTLYLLYVIFNLTANTLSYTRIHSFMFLSLSLQDHKSVLQCLILKYRAPRMAVLLYISAQKS